MATKNKSGIHPYISSSLLDRSGTDSVRRHANSEVCAAILASRNRKPLFILYAAVSLDGMITAGEKEGSEWTSREDKRFFHRELNVADVAIMGRKTFETIKRPLRPRNRIIFTHSPSSVIPLKKGIQNLIPFSGHPRKLLALLKKHHWTRVAVVGGTSIYDWFLKRNLVDEIYLTVEPLMFGSGKPLAMDGLKGFSKFELASVKRLNAQGTILLHYKNLL